MDEKALQKKINAKVKSSLAPIFAKYGVDPAELESMLKWKPLVFVIGNYSSGKSTFINEILGREVQRTGQAPTDDCFTILTAPEPGQAEGDIPGSDLVNDERLPFGNFKVFGEKFISHFRMRRVQSPIFDNLALVDSPGMLDSISEKDRGYDYRKVVREFAKLADIIVLMFDPHKAGTIQETYNTIRHTLPEATGEDRILFVMSRIDECDNIGDLVRSYGTLCWNLSQMTGRKDIPRIFLTYAPDLVEHTDELAPWAEERVQLKKKVLAAPGLRISHILQNVDKQIQELRMIAEAMRGFADGGKKIFYNTVKNALAMGTVAFLFLDTVTSMYLGFPEKTLLSSLIDGGMDIEPMQLVVPVGGLVVICALCGLWFSKWSLPRYFKRCRARVDALVELDTTYRQNVWERVRSRVEDLLKKPKFSDLFAGHGANVSRIDRFARRHLQKYYEQLE